MRGLASGVKPVRGPEYARYLGMPEEEVQQLILRMRHPGQLPEVDAELERMKEK